MPRQSSARAVLVAVVMLAGVPALVAGPSSAASIGQSNPGTVDINRTIVSPLGTHAGAPTSAVTGYRCHYAADSA